MTLKKCNRCHQEKPLEEFHRRKEANDGRGYWCKACHKLYYPHNTEKLRLYMRAWRAANRQHYADYQRKYREQARALAAQQDVDSP